MGASAYSCAQKSAETPKNPLRDAVEVTYKGEIPGYKSQVSYFPRCVEFGNPHSLGITLEAKNKVLYPQRVDAVYVNVGDAEPAIMYSYKRDASGDGTQLKRMVYGEGKTLNLVLLKEALQKSRKDNFEETIRWERE